MKLRHLVRETLAIPCVIMEEEPNLPGEQVDLPAKFRRLLTARHYAAIVVIWPHGAKMAAVQDELLLLVEEQRRGPLPRIFLLHHPRAARVEKGAFELLERGGRSRYTTAFQLLPVWPLPWRTEADLRSAAETVREELALIASEPTIAERQAIDATL
ncbi:MAG: hypothetical protein LC623_07130 [Halobacteriales archaeon]|nr:hypothetical protein [Halobacteriales archaeon]